MFNTEAIFELETDRRLQLITLSRIDGILPAISSILSRVSAPHYITTIIHSCPALTQHPTLESFIKLRFNDKLVIIHLSQINCCFHQIKVLLEVFNQVLQPIQQIPTTSPSYHENVLTFNSAMKASWIRE